MKKKRRIKKRRTTLQSLILSKSQFTKLGAKAWLKKHGFRRTLDDKVNTLRARQIEPTEFISRSFRTIPITTGIKAVIGHLK
jgi:hypothetical protein